MTLLMTKDILLIVPIRPPSSRIDSIRTIVNFMAQVPVIRVGVLLMHHCS